MKSTKYQVFLSSTYSDLKEERESIIKAILEMYHIPIGMEMFSAEDEDQWEIIRRTIEVSDYYVLVLGLRYGTKTSGGISFTQKEYEYALEKKIPTLAFVMKDEVSLPKIKRDDDLTEINKFREQVLTNSKMAQFWETKDELIKNVSISLMKQIMQKPGIGWVRGDKVGVEEALSKELSILSKENRELREKIVDLETKIAIKAPRLELEINSPVMNEEFNSYEQTKMPSPIIYKDIDVNLLDYISEDEVNKYNESLPSQKELDDYNSECEKIYRIINCSTPLTVKISNTGSLKASNLYIDIYFPNSLLVYENDKIISSPENPIPISPLKKALLGYEKSNLNPIFANMSKIVGLNDSLINVLKPIRVSPRKLRLTSLDKNKLTIKIDSLLHTRSMVYDDEYMLVPFRSGKHIIEVQIICEEFENLTTQSIDLEIR